MRRNIMEDKNDDESIGDFRAKAIEVGSASYKALKNAERLVKPGASLLEVAEQAEKYLKDNGFETAFPINLSIGNQAAHYTPSMGDEARFAEKDIVKIDFGAAKDGVLGDCALTVDFSGEYGKLVEATSKALENAIAKVKAGVAVREIGREISSTIEGMGFKPIRNLGGHGVGVHNLHDSPFIPNYDNGDEDELQEGTVVAIEPFATLNEGKGMVANGETAEIYSFAADVQPRMQSSRALLKEIKERFSSEPFAARWLKDAVGGKFELYSGLQELERLYALEPHPVLIEMSGKPVAQTEAAVYVTKDGCEVVTK